MPFSNLSNRLQEIMGKLVIEASLTKRTWSGFTAVRLALLKADVNYQLHGTLLKKSK